MKTDTHNKDFARRFALKQRLKWTRKGPIVYNILLAGWVCIIDLPDCFGINLLSTFSDVFGQTRFIIFRSSVSLAFMFPRSLMLREVRIRAKRVVLNETVPSSFSGMFILIRRWREKKGTGLQGVQTHCDRGCPKDSDEPLRLTQAEHTPISIAWIN